MWKERLKNPVLKNGSAVNQSFAADDLLPVPPGALDVGMRNRHAHHLVRRAINRDPGNAAVDKALKSGGAYALVEHSATDGSGAKDLERHRSDENCLLEEVQKAGCNLTAGSSVLRPPQDDRTWVTSPRVAAERRGTSDRFMRTFRKP